MHLRRAEGESIVFFGAEQRLKGVISGVLLYIEVHRLEQKIPGVVGALNRVVDGKKEESQSVLPLFEEDNLPTPEVKLLLYSHIRTLSRH
jgi:hypothetical protein